ncbi:MAG TPA: sigma-54 dependent transcriptional regulator [Candidatus Sabulitectum sp.]|nr:sigma-54 dependent transcriptional regulator [Candidatus Sabulitectum sp.]
MRSILLVEDKRGMRTMLTTALREEGWRVTAVSDGESALKALKDRDFSALLTDVCLPGEISGLDVLRASPRELPAVVMTAFGTIDMAVQAMKLGAGDFVSKPFQLDELLEKLGSVCRHGDDCMIGHSEAFTTALARAERAAGSGMNILVQGESGTGKELLARRIHSRCGRQQGPFIPVNCAAIPENLMESELFGAEKGAYTGSSEARPGRFTMAAGGTIFLDEIGDLGLPLQGKLLRVLESGTYHSVGGTGELTTDALVISASNRDLGELVRKGRFREDLFYRIAEFPVDLPPLRDRGDDLELLAEHFLELYGGREFTLEALFQIRSHRWPGNVRELKNLIRRACINSRDGIVTPELIETGSPCSGTSPGSLLEESAAAARERERELIRGALEKTGGNRKMAAEMLGVSYRTLMSKLRDMREADDE